MLEIVRAADSEAVGLRFIQRNNSDIDLEHKVAFNVPTIFSDILIEKNNIIDKLSKLRIYVIAHTLTSRKSQNLPPNTQGCISCVSCSYPELTEDHVLTSAYV